MNQKARGAGTILGSRIRRGALGASSILIGTASIISSLLSYYYATRFIVLSSDADLQLGTAAIATFIALALGLVLTFLGIHLLLYWPEAIGNTEGKAWFQMLSLVLSGDQYKRLFLGSAILYGIIFAVSSGTIIYDSSINYSRDYGVPVPSMLIIPCCNTLGQTPRLVAYLTNHLGVLLIPVNTVLLLCLSWLVGANVSLAAFAYRAAGSNRAGWLGSFGAATGFFTACPTCASALFVGGFGGEAIVGILAGAQILLIGFSTALLGANLVLMARRLANGMNCPAKPEEQSVS